MQVTLYLDVPPFDTTGWGFSAYLRPGTKLIGWKRYKIVVEVPEPFDFDATIPVLSIEETEEEV